ncbi:TetR/AcrR family transcriptional regulator [Microbacterium sp. No. 7]|uniref:TetR/AcrR family transcriptional regulator n=1 Tax=Microbacterium sp. No. 7 TaxID=1714373 RepID=UPI0006D1CB23|nr:TetR/AcrR family transcriptional regulator [Microbacterium sp. No. 7]ALJ19255.1 hypothetical protein AOA12_04795 [Microbacterium sp. No. 7]
MTGEKQENPKRKSGTAAGSRGPRGPYAKTRATRAAIVSAATTVFAADGFRSGSLRDIAVRVGMSEAGILHHFPNKVELLKEVLDTRDRRAQNLVLGERGDSDAEAILRGLVLLLREVQGERAIVELHCQLGIEASNPDHPAYEYFVQHRSAGLDILVRAFAELHEQGRFKLPCDPAFAANLVSCAVDGVQIRWLHTPDEVDMADLIRETIDHLVDIDWTGVAE